MNVKNQVQLIGHVGATPEVKQVGDGKLLEKLSLATNESYKNQQGEWVNKAEWHNIVAWGPQATAMQKQLTKGTQIILIGKLSSRSWETEQGEKKYITEVVANNFSVLSKKNTEGKTTKEDLPF